MYAVSLLIAESFGHAMALPHGVLAVLVNWAWTIEELFIGIVEIVLYAWLLYIVDEVFRSAATWLCSPLSLYPIIMTTLAIVVAPIAMFITPFFAAIIITTWVVIRAGSMSNIILELLISFFEIYV